MGHLPYDALRDTECAKERVGEYDSTSKCADSESRVKANQPVATGLRGTKKKEEDTEKEVEDIRSYAEVVSSGTIGRKSNNKIETDRKSVSFY